MISPDKRIDDIRALRRVLTDTESLFLDFDGPICSVFYGMPAHLVATELRRSLTMHRKVDLPADVEEAEDPFDVFRYAATLGQSEANYIETELSARELEAIKSARPTDKAHDLIRLWCSSGKRVVIVSNNSFSAIREYLERHQLTASVHAVSARVSSDPSLLKPDSWLVLQAVQMSGSPATRCCLIGDSQTDMQAAASASVKSVGYANKVGKLEQLSIYNPAAIVSSMDLVVRTLGSSGRSGGDDATVD